MVVLRLLGVELGMSCPSFPSSRISRKAMVLARFSATVEGRAKHYHGRVPGFRNVPLPVIGIIALLVLINMLVWVAAGVVLVNTPPSTFPGTPE